jgi:uncharacterized protein YuzE
MLEQTEAYLIMKRAKDLNQRLAWFDIFRFDTNFKNQILDEVREQLNQGKNSEGQIVGFYSYATELITKGRKQQGDNYNFQDTGDFFRSLYISYTPESMTVEGDGKKDDEDIIVKYSKDGDLLGISPENWDWFIEQMKEKYINYARKILFGSR